MARVSISSPRSNMHSTSYHRPSSGRRNSFTTYSDSYNGTYSPRSSNIHTGAMTGSYGKAANRFEPSPSPYSTTTYGNSYSTSPSHVTSKPPIGRTSSRITSPSPSRNYGTTSTSRPLPTGPGPKDKYGNRITASEARSTFRSSSRSRLSTPTSNGPLKADHSYSNGYSTSTADKYNPTNYSSTSPTSNYTSPRLSRGSRTNSIPDLTDSMRRTSLSNSKKYGSTADINGNLDSYSVKDLTDGKKSSFDSGNKKSTYTTTITNHSSSVESPLPDISDRPNSATSRSPSVDRTTKNNNTKNNNYSRRSSSPEGNKGLVGLRNLGNTPKSGYSSVLGDGGGRGCNLAASTSTIPEHKTLKAAGTQRCFMNSMIQCLSHTPKLRKYFLEEDYKSDTNTSTSSMKGALAKSFAKLFGTLWSKDSSSSVSPTDFKEKVSKFAPRFIGYSQQDAQEFLIYLLEGLQEDLNRNKKKKKRKIDCDDGVVTTPAADLALTAWDNYLEVDNSFIGDLFVGQLRSALTCTVCNYVSNTFDVFMDLSLPIKKKGYSSTVSLDDCFRLFTQEETLEGDERPTCAKCKKRQRCTKRFSIQKFPEILIIHLKRFNQDSYYRSKLSTLVEYPLRSLDLSDYAAESYAASSIPSPAMYTPNWDDGNESVLRPYYTGSRREKFTYDLYAVSCHSGTPFGGHYYAYAQSGNQWHEFNDQRVSSISSTRVNCSEGYVLFYQRS